MHDTRLVVRGAWGIALHRMTFLRFKVKHYTIAVGTIGLQKIGEPLHLDFDTVEKYRGCGYATEAAGLLCQWAFDELSAPRIVATTNVQNLGAQKVLGRCGFAIYKAAPKLLYCDKLNPKVLK